MVDEEVLERIYRERLDERIIATLAEKYQLDYLDAMDWYFNSRLASLIQTGAHGIQYLDHKVLVEMLEQTEPDSIPKQDDRKPPSETL